MTTLRVGDEVIVRSKHCAEWRGRLMRVGPCWVGSNGCEWVSGDHCAVLPVEPGKGWSMRPLVIRQAIVETAEAPALRLVEGRA